MRFLISVWACLGFALLAPVGLVFAEEEATHWRFISAVPSAGVYDIEWTPIDLGCEGAGSLRLRSDEGPEFGQEGSPLQVTITVDDQTFDRMGVMTEFMGLYGVYPLGLTVQKTDPLINALQSGSKGRLEIDGKVHSFPMKGSRDAIGQLLKACGFQ